MTTTTQVSGALTGDYVLDSAHSRIGFVGRAAMVVKVRGQFDAFEGSAHLDGDDPSKSGALLTIRAQSVQTHQHRRDDHLRSDDFLDVDGHPTITFTSTGVKQAAGTGFEVTGDLAIRGVTKPVTVHVELTGAEDDPRGGRRVGFEGRATINRTDWGISWGRGLIGRKVTLEFVVAATRQ